MNCSNKINNTFGIIILLKIIYAKVKYNIWKLDSRDIDNYTNIKATRDRFEKQLNDDLLRDVAVEVIEKYEDYLSSLYDKVIGINRGY